METVDQLVTVTDDIQEFAERYFNYVYKLVKQLDTRAIAAFVEELEKARKNENTVFLAGNGGSACTASHMANDLNIGAYPSDGKPFRAWSLTDNISSVTAIANDSGYKALFVKQLKSIYKAGDKLIVISASGNSSNVVDAAQWVKDQGGTVMGLLGFDGGKLINICDLAIHVKSPIGAYGPVEDVHLIMDHLIFTWLRYKYQKKIHK